MCYLTPVTLNKQKKFFWKDSKKQKNPTCLSVTCRHLHAPSLVLVELLTDISPICVEEFELCLKPRGIIWCAQLAYVLSSGVHSAHHHLLDGNGFCQVLDTESNMQTHDEWWPERARERQNDLIAITFQRNTKQAAQCCSYCPVRLWCPQKCVNTKSLDRHTQLNIKTLLHKSVSDTWWMVRMLLSVFQLRTNHTSSPSSTDAADEPLSKSELSFLRFSHLSFYLFPAKTEAAFRMEGQIPCHSNEMWHGQSCWHDLAYTPSNCVTAIHVSLRDVKHHTVICEMKRHHLWENRVEHVNARLKKKVIYFKLCTKSVSQTLV